ncbi:hypothetical protein POM88_017466 [Heracleum sosnowskyi]|uniref:Uncharacterized protein n=1 Tax=Heracleum sosnowskyi TaxID=360622 RepID=A0AAD8IQD2_9APIA|nr:hypothetical protein POM88_017466 [Heracleum sosnowskyi]
MDLLNGSSSSTTSYQQEVEPGSLLEECWFFENLLTCSKPKMSRCNSDPCPSTNFDALTTNQEQFLMSNANSSSTSSIKNGDSKFVAPKLVRAPSLPSNIMAATTVEVIQQNGRHDSGEIIQYKPQAQAQAVPPPQNTLLRAPSLPPPPPPPPSIGRAEDDDEEEEDQESEFRLGRLIRQASLKSSDTFLPPRQTPKSSSIARRSRKKLLVDGNKDMGNQYQMNQTKKGKLPSDIQKKEEERLEVLSAQFEKQCLENKVPTNKVSGLQDKSWSDQLDQDKKFRRPYTMSDSSPRPLMRSSTSIPKWATAAAENDKRSSQDMKAQIKFWARAVASNARAPGVL